MLDKDMFDRERVAYKLIRDRMQEMIDSGYEMRTHEKPVFDMFELMFVGPASKGGKSHVETMRLPFQLMASLMYDEPEAAKQWRNLLDARAEIDTRIYALIRALMDKKLGGKNDEGGRTGHEEIK